MKTKINNLRVLLAMLLVAFMTFGCTKDKLTDDLEVFKGRYTWKYSWYKENVLSSTYKFRDASRSDYTAEVEFTDKGKILFYINGEQIHKTGYSVQSSETSNGGNSVSLTVKPFNENSKKLDLNDNVNFSITNDTLNVTDFPGASYDESVPGTHYFLRN